MRRRNFIKSVLGFLAAPLVPKVAQAKDWNVNPTIYSGKHFDGLQGGYGQGFFAGAPNPCSKPYSKPIFGTDIEVNYKDVVVIERDVFSLEDCEWGQSTPSTKEGKE